MLKRKVTFRKYVSSKRSPWVRWYLVIDGQMFDEGTYVNVYNNVPSIMYAMVYKGLLVCDKDNRILKYDSLYEAKRALVEHLNSRKPRIKREKQG